jgi:hypothetical protein
MTEVNGDEVTPPPYRQGRVGQTAENCANSWENTAKMAKVTLEASHN